MYFFIFFGGGGTSENLHFNKTRTAFIIELNCRKVYNMDYLVGRTGTTKSKITIQKPAGANSGKLVRQIRPQKNTLKKYTYD